MKLASLKQGRDGALILVSRDLKRAVSAGDIAATLQAALDDWARSQPKLQARYEQINAGTVEGAFDLEMDKLASPLPRAYQWADGSAYVNHVELVRKARGAEIPESFWHDPLMYQGGSDSFLGPREPIKMADTAWGIDFEGEVAVVTDDVPMGCSTEQAADSIRLLMLVNDISLRGLIPAELAKGFGFFQSKPSSAFSPVAITPDELGDSWQDGRVKLPLLMDYNNKPFGKANAGVDMTFNFPQLIAHAAKSRPLGAGAIIGSGTVSNKQNTEWGSAIADGGVGYSCIAEVRMIETINSGKPETPFMGYGDTIRIRMEDSEGNNIFGDIDQVVEPYEAD
ncbi:fumarylacetoacetate hydrolase family protein [Sedimenticola selenatireducens]|uniref:Fumarylacetoacetate hydrolase family protein n=1 Tax=Sedimenticola selenatireducens TaxID=191960 RepID=A0A557S7Y9_9GAMM|nr:fumarylacetoacetate hydrolase family protein [Sedimenticola selenatireducens]TVO73494.1 fumarylacetoacetate hydrolase family protein [Sedimenticola selenatireducens]TVT63435.1 MAG: fumarylacetoacetate hydrolase family protein [Sedimenticola selenatireducens]